MNTENLEELLKLSLPALRYAELVNFARTESPSKAYELALLRWPRRQAKAVRSLAMVRRDYGVETLERLVMEHARPNGSEHAQTEKGDSMKLDAVYPEGVRDVVFVHDFGHSTPEHISKTLSIRYFMGEKHQDKLLTDEIKRFELDAENTAVLVQRVLTATLTQWANPKANQFCYGEMWLSAVSAAVTYLPQDKEMHKKVLLACVVNCGGHAKHVNQLVHGLLPYEEGKELTLQDVINYLLQCGCTPEEVQNTWTEMLKTRTRNHFKTVYVTDWWRGLKIGDQKIRAQETAQHYLLYELKDALVEGCFDWNDSSWRHSIGKIPSEFMSEIDFLLRETDGKWLDSDSARELVEDYFVQCIARGKVGIAFFFLVRFGGLYLGLYYFDAHKTTDERSPNVAMERLMRAAIGKAEELRNFGIASALAEYLGEHTEADRLRELARGLNQRPALDFMSYLEVKRN